MARLPLDVVKQEISDLGFTYKSGEYQNLKSVIVVECKEGHENTTTLHDLRKVRPCPICDQFEVTEETEEMMSKIPKKKGKRVLGIDNATKVSGYAVFEGGRLIDHGIKKVDNDTPQNLRIAYMKQWFISMLVVWDIDEVGLENVQYQGNPQTLITLSKLLGVLETASLEFNIEPYIVAAVTWKSHCGIKGRTRAQQKANARSHVWKTYGIRATEDAADAICLGEYVSVQERFEEGLSW